MPAHMFVLYYAVMSALTPPVAVAAYAAASIAEDNPLYIALLAVKFALAAFIVPFAFVLGPELLASGPWHMILISFATAAAGLILVAAAVEGYLTGILPPLQRVALGLGGFCLVMPNLALTAIGAVVAGAALTPSILAARAKT